MNGQFDIGAVSPSRYFFAIASLLGMLFAFIAPSPDEDWGFVLNIVQWQLQTLGPMAMILASHLVLSRSTKLESLNAWPKLIISGTLGALLFSPVAVWLDTVFAGERFERELVIAWMNELLNVTPPVVLCWLAINAPWLLGLRLQTAHNRNNEGTFVPPPAEEASSRQSQVTGSSSKAVPAYLNWPFMALLPEAIREKPIYLKAELHYLLVVTPKGRSLILYNLSDAIGEIGENIGYQPHRSYWVANNAAKSFIRRSRQGELTLTNGDHIPVSRRNVKFVSALQLNADET